MCSRAATPSPFDRIQATRLATRCIDFLIAEAGKPSPEGAFIGLKAGKVQITGLDDLPRLMDEASRRPKEQWWMDLRPIASVLAKPGPRTGAE